MVSIGIAVAMIVLGLVSGVPPAEARQGVAQAPAASTAPALPSRLPPGYDGPPLPAAPATMSRDAEGRVAARAVRLTAPIRLDGRLDEAVYVTTPPLSDFVQIEPRGGEPSSNKTEVWIFFDQDSVYVAARCWEDHMERIVATEMRHDNTAIFGSNDAIGFIFDTFYDRRNGVVFFVNALGGRAEGQATNERQYNGDWNGIWDVKVGRFEGGWSAELRIPFKSIRYRPGREQVWSLNVQRLNFWKNEVAFLTRIPPEKGPGLGMMMLSRAATLVGIEAPSGGKNIDIKPYAISEVTSDLAARPRVSNDVGGDIGLDAKYGVTDNTTLDLTYNTDFAQVEADEQQINLTRFNLFFPEKRDFFLENAGTFTFGGSTTISGGNTGDTPVMLYSRRIGLSGAREVPLRGGGRLTGRVGRYSLGVVNIQSGDEPAAAGRPTNFAVVRVKRDILRRSAVGLMYTGRSHAQAGAGRNDMLGADATLTFFTNVNVNAYWAATRTTARRGDDTSHRAQLDYAADRYGAQFEQLRVGANFNPEVGFVRRADMRRSYGQFRFSPRPRKRSPTFRKFWYLGSASYVENGTGRLETRALDAEFDVDFQNSDRFTIAYTSTYEFLPRPFPIAPTVVLPVGRYEYDNVRSTYRLGQQHRLSGTVSVERGTFYNGRRSAVAVSGGRVRLTPRFFVEPTTSLNWVDLQQGSFRTTLVGSRVTFTMTPLMFASALLQYNSGTNSLSSNVRFRWEYRPGSELFVVYNEQRDTRVPAFPDLTNRAFIVKVNRLLRF